MSILMTELKDDGYCMSVVDCNAHGTVDKVEGGHGRS
jgi:hypothetical protein